MTTSAPADWLKKIDQALLALNQNPQFGFHPSIPLQSLQTALAGLFKKPALNLQVKEKGWVDATTFWQGLGEKLRPATINFTPLEQSVFFVMSEQDLHGLVADLLSLDASASPFYDAAIVEGFYQYFLLVVMHNLTILGFAKPLSLRLGEPPQNIQPLLDKTHCFVIDIGCETGSSRTWGRVFIPKAFAQEWKQHFAGQKNQILDPSCYQLPMDLSIQVAESEILLDEWQRVEVGDLIILDRCSYDPLAKQGTAIVVLEQQSLFRGKFKEDGLQLLEFPHEDLGESMELEQEDSEHSLDKPELKIGALPVTMTVEVARIKMTVKEITELSVGSVLSLPVSVEDGVTLLINGKKVGRGELMSIGEALGVRIVSI